MKSFVMTPQLAAVLSDFCSPEAIDANLDAIESLQDFVLANGNSGREKETLGQMHFLRNLRSMFVTLQKSLSTDDDNL